MITDVIRPGSVLSDPYERQAWEHRLAVRADDNHADMTTILATHPWHRFPYRFGHWEAEQITWKALLTFTVWESYRWVPEARNFSFQLLDPLSRAVLNELKAPGELLTRPGGEIEYAGNPETVGVYRIPGTSADRYEFGWCRHLDLGKQRAGIDWLREGGEHLPPPYADIDYRLFDRSRAWYLDSPAKPARRPNWKYGTPHEGYDPGALNPFTGRPIHPAQPRDGAS